MVPELILVPSGCIYNLDEDRNQFFPGLEVWVEWPYSRRGKSWSGKFTLASAEGRGELI